MRKGVLTVEITNGDGDVTRLASRMYADSNTLFRGHLRGFSQTRRMTDALAGRTSMSVANLIVHNQNEEYDLTEFSGTADIKIGADSDTFATMDDVMLDAQVEAISRTDNEISISVLDGQSRGNTKQQRIFDTSGEGFGTLLPELWGEGEKFPLIQLDAAGLVYACAGPMVSMASVYIDNIRQTTGFTRLITTVTSTVTFTVKPEGSVFVDAVGFGGTLPGELLIDLLTRVSTVCQGHPLAGSGSSITLDERADDATETLVGKSFVLFRAIAPHGGVKTITAYDSATRIATLDSTLVPSPAVDDIYSIWVNTAAGGFTTAQVDSTGFDALDTALPYTFGLIASNGISAIEMQDQLLSPLLCHMGPKRDGIVHLTQLTPPVAPSVLDITRIIGEMQRVPLPIYWHVEARYRSDNTGGHWSSVSAFDATIKADYPNAQTLTIDVPVQESAGALLVAEQWLTCFGFPTELVSMDVDHDLSVLDLSDVVNVTDDRYQFSGGKYATVVSMTDVFDGYDQLTVWVASQ